MKNFMNGVRSWFGGVKPERQPQRHEIIAELENRVSAAVDVFTVAEHPGFKLLMDDVKARKEALFVQMRNEPVFTNMRKLQGALAELDWIESWAEDWRKHGAAANDELKHFRKGEE